MLQARKGPWRITFDTNPDDCNLSCIMCEDHSPYSQTRHVRVQAALPKRRMDIRLIEKILASVQGMPVHEIIPSTMGEPLIYKDFEKIIELCHQYQLKLNLTTNGTFPRKGVEGWGPRIVPIASDIKISWNGATKATQEKIMLGSQWEKVLTNVRKLVQIRNHHFEKENYYCQISLQLTFLEHNVQELADIVALGIELGIDRIKGHHLWAHFDQIKALSMRRNPDAIRRWNTAVLQAQAVAANCLLPNGKTIKLENIYCLDETAIQDLAPGGECPFLGKEAWVATDGRFSPCCAPDQERRKLGDFGSLADKSLEDIWNSALYQDLCQNYMKHAVCQACNMRKPIDLSQSQKVQKNIQVVVC